jgi:hypothetical protein
MPLEVDRDVASKNDAAEIISVAYRNKRLGTYLKVVNVDKYFE